jgi:hypothetical protein
MNILEVIWKAAVAVVATVLVLYVHLAIAGHVMKILGWEG